MRWKLFLQSFDIEVEYIKGSTNIMPDALSRLQIGMQNVEVSEGKGLLFAINFLTNNFPRHVGTRFGK